MYNGNGSYTPTLGGDSSPNTNATATPNDPSASGPGPGPARGAPMVQLASDGFPFSLESLHPPEPVIQSSFQHIQRNTGGVFNNATVTPSSGQGGDVTIIPYGSFPIAVPNVPNGQASSSNPDTNFQAAGPPGWYEIYPEVFPRPDARGTTPVWRLVDAELDFPGGDDLRVTIHFRRISL